ncbi:GNAT family N-acetyltransferase [Alkalihalobacillus alcalophilus]|nr:N-acetyltransferase [Alkalihalobacillus alcalophilus]
MRKEHQPIQRKGKDIELHNQNEKAEFIQLHEQTFKQAYYSGAGILERLNETNRLFIYKSDSHVVGYVYLEGTPAFREGTIEFIGVDKLHRNKGIGRQLLQEALDFLFGELKVNELSLVVSEDKKDAFHLYRSIGFSVRYELVSYELKKQINS